MMSICYTGSDKKAKPKWGEITREEMENLLAGMTDAGCNMEKIQRAKYLLKTGHFSGLTKFLKGCRCAFVEQMHQSKERVDRIDYLIRQAEKIKKGWQES